jgi:hypothetical protein
MSVAILEEPNLKNLYCNSLTFGNGTAFQIYLDQAFSSAVTGIITGSTAGLYRQLDRFYSLSMSGISATGSGTPGVITFSTALPTNLWTTPLNFPIWVEDGGVYSVGNLSIGSGGIITIYKGFNGNFTATGTCGFPEFNISFCSYRT